MSSRTHAYALIIAAIVVGVFALQGGLNLRAFLSGEPEGIPMEIAIEHEGPLSASLEVSTLRGNSIVSFEHEASDTTHLSVPEDFERMEIRNASLSDVVVSDTSLGFKRWQLPARAGISFRVSYVISTVTIHNPGEQNLKLSVTRVNLEDETSSNDVYLMNEKLKEI